MTPLFDEAASLAARPPRATRKLPRLYFRSAADLFLLGFFPVADPLLVYGVTFAFCAYQYW